MDNTDNYVSRCLVTVLENHGITDAVVSPGSRNAPLLIALSRSNIRTTVVVDERSAAFIGLGIATCSGRPVVLVCTSGTALLNYGPAVAEAYYRRQPLIIISADRPKEWIDQDDSQTIHQHEALANYVKRSYDIPYFDNKNNRWFANRVINDAILCAKGSTPGPVHINVQLSEPLGGLVPITGEAERTITMLTPSVELSCDTIRELAGRIASPCKVMVIAGFQSPDMDLNQALGRLALLPNVVVLTETTANLHSRHFVDSIDRTLSAMTDQQRSSMVPDVVITIGGALVSRHIKQYLREYKPSEHWHVGRVDATIDCFQALTCRVDVSPAAFFGQLVSFVRLEQADCDYARKWSVLNMRAYSKAQSFVNRASWSDLKAFGTIIPMIPNRWNVHFSNGTAIRYAQLFSRRYHDCECNRGVSGIDGCTSTAIGASIAYDRDVTLLITGDMSAQYDIGALACRAISPRFKMIVIRNGGGGIFRFINSTRHLDIVNNYFSAPAHLPLKELAAGYGFAYFEVDGEEALRQQFPLFVEEMTKPCIMAVDTPADVSAKILLEYFQEQSR